MPYVKVTGYIEVPDEHYDERVRSRLTNDGHDEAEQVPVGELEDLTIGPDDRGGMK